MSKKRLSDFDDAILIAKEAFKSQSKEMLNLVRNSNVLEIEIQDKLTELHSSAVNYFSLFENSLSSYSFFKYFTNINIRNEKLNEAISTSNTIIKYWKLIDFFKQNYPTLTVPKLDSDDVAYSTIQAFISEFDTQKSKKLRIKYKEIGLPTNGFTNQKFIDMTKKQQIKFGAITGLVLLVVLLVITLFIECPTSSQSRMFTTVLALAAAAFASIIPGILNIKYRTTITAGGALAVFVIVFFMKPAELSDFKSCQEDISGTVYFGGNTMESIDIHFPKQSKTTKSDNHGNFKLPLDFSSIDESLKIQLKNEDIALDTLIVLQKSELSKSLDIYIKEYCVKCTQKDSTGLILLSKEKCSASYEYITDYMVGFTRAGKEQGRITECTRK